MSGNSNTQPPKGILKHTVRPEPVSPDPEGSTEVIDCSSPSTSGDKPCRKPSPIHTHKGRALLGGTHPHLKFDEKNIAQTLHPSDKDYGFDKIDEPKTPYNNYEDPVDDSNADKCVRRSSFELSSDDNKALDPQLLSKLLEATSRGNEAAAAASASKAESDFEERRKQHYNFKGIQLARDSLRRSDLSSENSGTESDSESQAKPQSPKPIAKK